MTKIYLFIFMFFSSLSFGQSWVELTSPTTARIESCSFVNENIGWIITAQQIFKTVNGGTSWTSQNFPPPPENNFRFFTSVHFITENIGVISCGNYLYSGHNPALVSTVMWTNDGGVTWVYRDIGENNSYNSSAHLVSPTTAYTIGQYGNSKRTLNAGLTWTDCDFQSVGYSGRSLFSTSSTNIYFAGLHNITLISTFGRWSGSMWLTTEFPDCIIFQDIFFIGNTGWLVGNDGTIKRTTNNGSSWTSVPSGVTSDIYGLTFKNGNEGWAVTSEGEILRTLNSGITWTIDHDVTPELTDVTFQNLNGFGYAVGAAGHIYKFDPNLSVDAIDRTKLSVFPNPASGTVTIKNTTGHIITKMEFYNSVGQLVKENISPIAEENFAVDVSLPTGIYHLKISFDDTSSLVQKIIIK